MFDPMSDLQGSSGDDAGASDTSATTAPTDNRSGGSGGGKIIAVGNKEELKASQDPFVREFVQ